MLGHRILSVKLWKYFLLLVCMVEEDINLFSIWVKQECYEIITLIYIYCPLWSSWFSLLTVWPLLLHRNPIWHPDRYHWITITSTVQSLSLPVHWCTQPIPKPGQNLQSLHCCNLYHFLSTVVTKTLSSPASMHSSHLNIASMTLMSLPLWPFIILFASANMTLLWAWSEPIFQSWQYNNEN